MHLSLRHLFLLVAVISGTFIRGQTQDSGRYVSGAGSLSFSLPKGWTAIPTGQIQAFNQGLPENLRFQGGIVDNQSPDPKVYMLLQVKQRPVPSAAELKAIQGSVIRIDALSSIADVIARDEHREKSEFYSPKYDSFLRVTEQKGRLSIMVKHFTSEGYYLMHFYLGSDPAKQIADIDHILSSVQIVAAQTK